MDSACGRGREICQGRDVCCLVRGILDGGCGGGRVNDVEKREWAEAGGEGDG